MAELTTVARPYAEAVAQLAHDGQSWQAWSEALALLAGIASDPQVLDMAQNPAIPDARVVDLVLAVGGDRLSADAANLVRILAENKRLPLLPTVASLFEEARAKAAGEVDAHITSAYPLDAAQLTGLQTRLEARLGRKVQVTTSVDAALIGGVVIAVGDEVMDASVRGKIADLAVAMTS
ncbi:MAG: F0F1 ATP synthase subunit delta [Betaproteobacteria bacterium]|nr:F0F1 ATP synthase subunit delta [Betaproteobacteria bacterium]